VTAASARLTRVLADYVAVARSPSFFPLWLAQLVSTLGDTLHYIALVVLVYDLTGRGASVAVLVAAELLPVLLLGPVAGVIIDRVNRKSILIVADLVRAMLALSLVWPHGVRHAYAVAAALSAAAVFFNPTVQAVIPHLTTPDQRLTANSVAWSTGRLVQIAGAAVAGGLIGLIGTGAAFATNAATFGLSALLIVRLHIPPTVSDEAPVTRGSLHGYLADVRAGLSFVRRDRFLSRFLPVQALASLATGGTGAMLVVLSERHLRLPPSGFAWLIAAIGLGALIGPLIPNLFAGHHPGVRWLFVPYLIRGAGDIAIALMTPLPVALAILFIYGLNTSTGMVVQSSMLQRVIPDRVRGRVLTLLDITWNAARLLSLAAAATLVDVIGIEAVYWIGGTMLAVSGAIGLSLLGQRSAGDRRLAHL